MDDDYESYSDDDFLQEYNDYVEQSESKDKDQTIPLMVGGFLGLWWYLRSYGAATSTIVRTYAAVADREAKLTAWRNLPGSINQKVKIINEFGACDRCVPYLDKIYSLEEAQNLVPFHRNCRCTLIRVGSAHKALIAGALAGITSVKNNEPSDEDLERIADMIELGDLSPLTMIEDYMEIRDELTDSVVGLKTVDGHEIKSFTNHFIDRTIGGGWQNKHSDPWKGRRSGVTIKDIIDTLENGRVKADKLYKNQVQYISDRAQISFDFETGKLIQVNPTSEEK